MIQDIAAKVDRGERLTAEDGRRLFRHPNLPELAMLADAVRRRKHPEPIVTYNIGRNINYTNICWVQCDFCAFHRPPGSPEGYVLTKDQIFRKIDELVAVGGEAPGSCEVLMQGGLNPKLRLEYFEDLFSEIRARYPQVHIHSLSAPEILYLAHVSRLSVTEVLQRLHQAGLASLPGAGAEILVDEVRHEMAFRKDTTQEWLNVHRTAHRLGIPTTATMMYGSIETLEHRVLHLLRLRAVQDEALALARTWRELFEEKGGVGEGERGGKGGWERELPPDPLPSSPRPGCFTAFISWSFQPDRTALASRRAIRKASGYDYLRTVAVSRLLLDNIENFQASYVTQGPKIAQIALHYGLNDFGSTMMEENVVRATNTYFLMPISEIERLIRQAGFEPRRRNTRYELV